MISVDTALELLEVGRPERPVETIDLNMGLGRDLAHPIVAQVTLPPATVSAMDGYAVRLEDVSRPRATLNIIGEAPAGTPFNGRVGPQDAVRIFTGGQIPDGADHVVIQENTKRTGDTAISLQAYSKAAHIRTAGLDFEAGQILVEAGTRLSPASLSIAAAANLSKIQVHRKLRVGIFANGDELQPPGTPLAPGQIVNSNPTALCALVSQWGGEAIDLGIAPDSLRAIRSKIDHAKDIDIFVPIGGASVGDHDHMRPAFAAAGFEPIFEKIAVKPGKPTWFSRLGDQLVLGLPGNPASALVCAHLFLKPLLANGQSISQVSARLNAPIGQNGAREHYLRARIYVGDTGQLEVSPAPNQDSSLLTPFLVCNALIRRRPDAQASPVGEMVEVQLLGPILG